MDNAARALFSVLMMSAAPSSVYSYAPALFGALLLHGIVLAVFFGTPETITPPQPIPEIEVALSSVVAAKAAPPPPKQASSPPPPKAAAHAKPVPTTAPVLASKEIQPSSAVTPAPVQAATPTAAPTAVAAPAAPAVNAAPAPEPVVGPRFDAAYLDNPKPTYPLFARRNGLEGRVLLRVLVTAEGTAEEVHIAQSSGAAILDKAARDAVLRWRFTPARQGSKAVADWVQVPIVFGFQN